MTTASAPSTRPLDEPAPGSAGWRVAWLVAGGVVTAAVTVLGVALVLGGGRPESLPGPLDGPGPLTGWGLPLAKLALDVCAVGAVGALLVAVVFAPSRGAELSPAGFRAARAAGLWALAWAVAAIAVLALQLSEIAGLPLAALTSADYVTFVVDIPEGRALALVAVLASVVVLARWTLGVAGGGVLLLLAVLAVVPPAFVGHSASAADHDVATSSLVVHVVAATLWVGGLVGLLLHGRRTAAILARGVPMFSALALGCYVAVGASGVVNAAVRLGSAEALLGSSYGLLVVGKVGALAVLGWLGWLHRRRTVSAVVSGRPRAFARLASVEVAVMAAVFGLAVALSRTPTPVPDVVAGSGGPAEFLLGYSVPPFSVGQLLTAWRLDLIVLTAVAVAATLYARGVRRLRRRGDRWPPGRTVAFALGLLAIAFVLSSGLATYGQAAFSAHMVQHMTLTMLAPILLALGAPITLALRALPSSRQDSGRGAREWILAGLHSRVVRVLTHPLVALTLYVVTLYGFYYSPVFELTLRSHVAHLLMHLHFVAVGSLYFWPIIGVDPMPRRLPYLGRMLLLFASMPFHAFFAVAVMGSTTLLAGDWFRALSLPWLDPVADQRLGGGIAWTFGEVPALVVLAALFVQWRRADRRESARMDRRADADDDAALAAYNARLAEMGRRHRP